MTKFLSLRRDNSNDEIFINPEFIVSMERATGTYTVVRLAAGGIEVVTVAQKPHEIINLIGATRQA